MHKFVIFGKLLFATYVFIQISIWQWYDSSIFFWNSFALIFCQWINKNLDLTFQI